jgi:hypothetical protein
MLSNSFSRGGENGISTESSATLTIVGGGIFAEQEEGKFKLI